jgi:selenocysteine lyase/cysteine desulfurase
MIPSNDMALKEDLVYFNHASIGPLPRRSLEIINHINQGKAQLGEASLNLEVAMELWEEITVNIAKLLNGKKEGVAITSNTASALHVVADGLYKLYSPGKNIIITAAEFATNSYLWQQLTRRHRMELRVVPIRNGKLLLEDWERLIDDQTVVVSLSHVQFSNGFRSNLKQISQITHEHGAYVVVDAIQSLGIVPFDVQQTGVDFVAAGGYKWLLGPYSIGLFYTIPEYIELLDTILVGWSSREDFWNHMTHNPYAPRNDARRFQQSPNMGIEPLNASIETVMSWDISNSYNHVISLLDYLIDRLNEIDMTVSSPLDPNSRSGILKIDTSKNAFNLMNYLKELGIITAYREGGIRISPHAYNSKEDIDKLFDAMKLWFNNN